MRSGQFSKNYGIAIITINNPPVKRCDCHVWLPNCRGNAARPQSLATTYRAS